MNMMGPWPSSKHTGISQNGPQRLRVYGLGLEERQGLPAQAGGKDEGQERAYEGILLSVLGEHRDGEVGIWGYLGWVLLGE